MWPFSGRKKRKRANSVSASGGGNSRARSEGRLYGKFADEYGVNPTQIPKSGLMGREPKNRTHLADRGCRDVFARRSERLSFYIAVTTFHQEMLPTTLLISLAAQREGVPFPAFVEALAMEFTFEVLREAGVRMPRAIGSAVSIVGALVLGQAAVQAGLVSAAMVIVVAFTAISNFVAPSVSISNSTRLLRFSFMVLAATLGLFGIMAGLIAMLIHLTALRSFGIPYMLPLAPFAPTDQKDVFVRVPWWAMILRPRLISPQNPVREKKSLRPNPPERNDK